MKSTLERRDKPTFINDSLPCARIKAAIPALKISGYYLRPCIDPI
jgi:hypothetical protein